MNTIKALFVIGVFLAGISSQVQAQVGINTETPLASLDVNGDLRVTDVETDNNLTDVLVIGADNIVRKGTNFQKAPATPATNTFVNASGSSSISILNVVLLTGWNKIQFPSETLDEHSDYNPTTSEFVAPETGVYSIYAQFKVSSLASLGDIGIGIFKRDGVTGAYTLLAEETYTSISVVSISVSPPTRNTQTLVKLAKNDVITFGAKVPLVSLSLIGGSSSFFSIYRVE